MSTLTITISDEQFAELKRIVEGLGVEAEDLARDAIESIVRERRELFNRAAEFVLDKNSELYIRLAR